MNSDRPPDSAELPLLERVLSEQSALWKQGERVSVEELLARYPALRDDPTAVLDLIYHEYLLRRRLNEAPIPAEFIRRFPEQSAALLRQFAVDEVMGSAGVAEERRTGSGAGRLGDGSIAGTARNNGARAAHGAFPHGPQFDGSASESHRDLDLRVSIVRGSGSHQATDLEHLLRGRMRIAATIILVGFGVFLLIDLVSGRYAHAGRLPLLFAHLAVIFTAVVGGTILWGRRHVSLRSLRALETAHILVGTLFFALYQASEFYSGEWGPLAREGHHADVIDLTGDSCVLRWFAFIVIYGFFVPNTWGRCARIVSCIAVCPLAVTTAVGIWESTLGEMKNALLDMGIWMAIATAMAIYGSHKVTQLRHEAMTARKLGQYRLKRRLGRGGMGEVYLAEHQLLKRPCAIKLIRKELVGERNTLSLFEREVQATAALNHPNIVQIYDFGVADDGTFYYTMEYLPGMTLQEMVKDHGPLPSRRAVHLLRQVCRALREAHARGLIHRDLKPGNLIASQIGCESDVVKLLDFGLVGAMSVGRDLGTPSSRDLIAGTPAFLSPEQAAGRAGIDGRSDIYSLGAVGYFLLSGRPPFEGQTTLELLLAHQRQVPRPLSALAREVPADVEAVISRCLEKEPHKRFPDARSVEEALSKCECAADWSEDAAREWWNEHPARDLASEPEIEPSASR
jgi:serine/threonine-protein kinase